jgi:phospholipase/carboxylesterase
MDMTKNITRREALGVGLTLIGGAALGCRGIDQPLGFDPIDLIRINARPGTSAGPITAGLHSLDVAPREALLYVPPSYDPGTPAPLVLMLHGVGGTAQQPITLFESLADASGLVLVSAKSLGPTWDGVREEYTDDIPLLNRALELAFGMVNADPARIGIEGFSDGASYALQLGRANGDLFKRVVSFSAGLLLFTTGIQRPRFFVAHGTQDDVVSVQTGRNIAAQLDTAYDVVYHEFPGGHAVPASVAQTAVAFLTAV